MDKKIYLTPQEQELFRVISSMQLVDTTTIHEIFPGKSPHQVNRILSRLSQKGYLHRVKKGVYLISPHPSGSVDIKKPVFPRPGPLQRVYRVLLCTQAV